MQDAAVSAQLMAFAETAGVRARHDKIPFARFRFIKQLWVLYFLSILVYGCECSKDQRLLGGCCRTFTTSEFTNGQLLSTMEGGDRGTVIASHWLIWSQALCLAQRPAFGKSHNLHQWTFRSLQHLVRARMLWAWGRWQGAKSRCCVRRWVKSELLGKQESTDQEHCRVSYIMIWFHFVICMNTCMLQCDSSIPVIFLCTGPCLCMAFTT